VRSVAPGAAARMAALIFARSLCASFGHLAMYSSTPLRLRFVTVAFSPCRSVFFIVIDRDFTRRVRQVRFRNLGLGVDLCLTERIRARTVAQTSFCALFFYNRSLLYQRIMFEGPEPMPQSEIIFSVQESPEGGYEARALGFSIFTQADSLDELKTVIRDAVSCHFDASDKPSVIRLHLGY
jgi:hypothetical protein